MPIFRATRRALSACFRSEDHTLLRFKTTRRIATAIRPDLDRLLEPGPEGETYRMSVAHWRRRAQPPVARYLGTSSLCLIEGPLTWPLPPTSPNWIVPSGGFVESPGFTITLSPSEASNLHERMQEAIERELLIWLSERDARPKAAPSDKSGSDQPVRGGADHA